MTTVVTLTLNPCLDQITGVDRVRPNQKLRMDAPRYDPGGGGVNVSRAIVRLGGDTCACYLAGGPTGEHLGQRLNEENVPRMPVSIDGFTRVNPNVLEHQTNDLYRFILPGPEVGSDVIDRCRRQLEQMETEFTYVVISGSLPAGLSADALGPLLQSLRRSGKRVILDSSGPALIESIKAGVYLVKPNYREFAELTGKEPESDADVETESRKLIERHGVDVVFATLGAGGAMIVSERTAERILAPTVKVRSRIGAGDSVVGALSMALADGWDLAEAARFAVAAGAAAVTTPGTELCRRDDTQRLFQQMTSPRQTEADHD